MIVIDLSKQQTLNVDPKVIQRISFTWNLSRQSRVEQCFSLMKKQKELSYNFHKEL